MLGTVQDVTQRKQAQEALEKSETILHFLAESIPQQVWIVDADGNLVYINERVLDGFGSTREGVLGGKWSQWVHPDHFSIVVNVWNQSLATGMNYEVEFRLFQQPSATYHWHLGRALALSDRQGKIVNWFGTNTNIHDRVTAEIALRESEEYFRLLVEVVKDYAIYMLDPEGRVKGKVVSDKAGNPFELVGYWADITSRKQLEQELTTVLEKEKELNKLKSRFISMTSHQFPTPLSTILSSAELLEHYHQRWTEEKLLMYLRRIQTAVHRMTQMLDDILVIGKAEAGKLEYKPLFFDLVEYCRQIVEEVRLNLKSQHLIFFSRQCKSISCYMDDKLLGYIISNLLSNVLKYSPDGSLVRFTLACKDEQGVMSVIS